MADEDEEGAQLGLFGDLSTYADEHWRGMPEFVHRDLEPRFQVVVSFANRADRDKFAALVGQHINDLTRSIWFPPQEMIRVANKKCVAEEDDA